MAGQFRGFPREGLRFFKRLETHNERAWFQAHKDTYERACREPMQELMAELEPTQGPNKIFRINRDIRFSSDKSPYKTHIAAVVGGYYIHLSKAGLYVATGIYRRKGYQVETHETLTGAPRGYAMDHPRIDLLRMKDLVAGRKLGAGPWLSTRKALGRVERVMRDVTPFKDWLRRHVG